MRQTRLSLNKEMHARQSRAAGDRRVLRSRSCSSASIRASSCSTPDRRRWCCARFLQTQRANRLFIVDPLGNLVMRYDARENPKGLLQDLKKLLKLSHIG